MQVDTTDSSRPKVTWSQHSKEMAELLKQVGQEECVKVMRSLFDGYREIALEPLSQGKSGAIVLRAKPIAGNGLPEVYRAVKIGDVADLRLEKEHFEEYVQDKLRNHPNLNRVHLPPSGKGALAYTLVGDRADKIQTLAEFFDHTLKDHGSMKQHARNVTTHPLTEIIIRLFRDYLQPWYGIREIRPVNLFADAFDLSDEQLEALKGLAAEVGGRAPEMVGRWERFREYAATTPAWYVIVHGDLHSGNVILNIRTNDISLIDFGLTECGHFLKDFVKLETDLKFRFIRALSNLEDQLGAVGDFLRLEVTLQDAFDSSELPTANDYSTPLWLVQVLWAIRRLAGSRMEGQALSAEYTVGLVRYALRMALYQDNDITPDHQLSMLRLGVGYLRDLELDENRSIRWRLPEDGGRRGVGPVESASLQQQLRRLGISPAQELDTLDTDQRQRLADPKLIVGNVVLDGEFVGGFEGVGPESVLIEWHPQVSPRLPDYVLASRTRVEKTPENEKRPNNLKVFLDRWQPAIVDQGNLIRLVASRSDWWMREGLQASLDRLHEDILKRGFALSNLSRPLDVVAAVVTADNKIVLLYRGEAVRYEPNTWSIPGEQMDAEKDYDSQTGSVSPGKTLIRLLTETDEVHLPTEVATSAQVRFIAIATEWDMLLANLVAVVNLREVTSVSVRDYFARGEHDFVRFVTFDPEPCLQLLNDNFRIHAPGSSKCVKLTDICRFSVLAALFNKFNYFRMLEKIKSLSESY